MSCHSCHHSPCTCSTCNISNEPLASVLNNFIDSFFGTVTKSCVNNEVVWSLPCNLDVGVPGFPRNAGEGLACYILRLAESLEATEGNCCCFIPDNTIIVKDVCYTTWQSAYNAATAMPDTGIAMYVGKTNSASTLGDLTLTSDYDSRIYIVGQGKNNSYLGNIHAINSGNGFNVSFTCKDILMGNISTYTTDSTGTFDGGDISITTEGILVMGNLNTSAITGNRGGDISFFNHDYWMLNVDTRGQNGGGNFHTSINLQETYGTNGGRVARLDTRSMSTGAAGNVIIGAGVNVSGDIDVRAIGAGTGGTIEIRARAIVEGNIARGTVTPGAMQLDGCYIYNRIDNIGAGCKFKDVVFLTEANNDSNIQEVVSNGALFTGCFFITDGTGFPIQASVPRTIISHFTVSRRPLDADVTVSSGTFTVEAGLAWTR